MQRAARTTCAVLVACWLTAVASRQACADDFADARVRVWGLDVAGDVASTPLRSGRTWLSGLRLGWRNGGSGPDGWNFWIGVDGIALQGSELPTSRFAGMTYLTIGAQRLLPHNLYLRAMLAPGAQNTSDVLNSVATREWFASGAGEIALGFSAMATPAWSVNFELSGMETVTSLGWAHHILFGLTVDLWRPAADQR